MKNYGVLFDYNGVIVTDEHIQERATSNILKRYSIELSHQHYQEYCLGRPDRDGFEKLKDIFAEKLTNVTSVEFIAERISEYNKLIQDESIVHPSLKNILLQLQGNYQFAIVSGASRAEILPILEETKLLSFFEKIITVDDIQRGKPDPEGYLKGVAALGIPKENIVVIEDTPAGVHAAKAAGLKCIALLATVSRNQLDMADLVVENLSQVNKGLIQKVLHS